MFVWRLSAGVFRLSCSLLISVVCIPVLPRPRRLKGLFRSPLSCNHPNYSQRTKTCFWPPEVITSPTCYICYIYSYQYLLVNITHQDDRYSSNICYLEGNSVPRKISDNWSPGIQERKEYCPGFGQDRVNFHKTPGGDTAKQADPNWPNKTGYLIPCAIMLGSGWGSWAVGRQS